jgi:Acyl-CoA synthetases (AMP-forming)/AMP-acid ligases II
MMPISWILPRARAMFPDRPAIVDGDVRHTFEQLGRRVDALVGGLKTKGVKQGDRVAILDVNSPTYAEAYYACAQAGMVLVPLNSRLAAPELRYILNDAAQSATGSDAFFPTLEGLRDSLPTVEHVFAYGNAVPAKPSTTRPF